MKISRVVQRTVAECWEAVTAAASINVWLGECSGDMRMVGDVVTIDTGGKILAAEVRTLVFCSHVELMITDVFRRAPHRVTIDLQPLHAGSHVELALDGDVERRSGDAAVWELRFQALLSYISHLQVGWHPPGICLSAYPLPWGWRALHPDTVLRWLPVSINTRGLRTLFIVDEVGPQPVDVKQWLARYDDSLTLVLDLPVGQQVDISVRHGDQGMKLDLDHSCWMRPSRPAESELRLYARFRDMWATALAHAHGLAALEGG